MAGMEPGERGTPPGEQGTLLRQGSRRLAEPPSARYERGDRAGRGTADDDPESGPRSGLRGPLIRAVVVAVAGTAFLWLVGAVLASTEGLLFVSGAVGATTGLVLARAAVPPPSASPVPRQTVVRLSIILVLVAIAVGDVMTWVFARQEGGTLGLVDYLWTTFGPFVPGEAIVGALAAWWGATSGPVR